MADGFGGWLGSLGSGISNWFSGGSSVPSVEISDPGGLQPLGDYSNLNVAGATSGVGGGGGFGGWLGNLGQGLIDTSKSDPLGTIGKIAGLGTTAMGIYGGINQMQQGADQMRVLKQQQRQQQQMAAPAAQAGGALTSAGQSALLGGSLPPALEAQVEDFKNKARMQMQQRLASQGMTDSSAGLQYDAWIENQAQQLRGQLASNLYNQGLAGIGTALGPSSTVSQTALGMAGGSQQSIAQAQEALNKLLGSQ